MQKPTISDSPAEIHIQLLDGFSLTIGERRISADQFRLRKSRSLIKLLALAPNHRLQRDQLLEQLWPDQDPQTAAKSFYQVLYETRRILDPSGANPQGYLLLHETVLSLSPNAPVLIDAEAFKTAANRAFRTRDQAAYQDALALYPGELLPDDRYEDWASELRETFHLEHLRLLLGLAKLLEKQTDYSSAIDRLKQVLVSDPPNEEAHAGLMRLYAVTGYRQLALRQYQLLEETLQRELEAKPDPSITHLYQEILSGQYTYTPTESSHESVRRTGISSSPVHNLPIPMNSFIGREQEKQEIKHLFLPHLEVKGKTREKAIGELPPARLVTLTGAGGCGKTRLALETVGELLEKYRDGVWLIELAGLSDPELVPQTVVSTLRIQNTSGQPPPSILADFLRHKQLLLFLDNCEHLIEACASLVETLLKNCPNLQILTTSQEVLGLPGEVSYFIAPLSLPDNPALLPYEMTVESEAIRLFVERASYALPGFTLNESNAPAVLQICRRLDGIPLAIELAAARVRMMQVEEIATLLEQSFDLLTGGSRTALPRYQSLHASIDWSYHLLSKDERLLFRRLAVFAGGWSLDAARCLATGSNPSGVSPQPTEDVLELLIQLVNKSLITSHQIPGAQTRYFYLDTIRTFALDRLRDAGEEEWMRDRHLDYYEELAVRTEPLIRGSDRVTLMPILESEQDNLRAALEWSLSIPATAHLPPEGHLAAHPHPRVEKGLRLAAALIWLWHFLYNRTEPFFWLERLLASEVQDRGSRPLDPSRALARAKAFYVIGWFGWGDLIQKYMEESLLIFRELGPEGRLGAAGALNNLAGLAQERGDYPLAQSLASESLALFREVGNSFDLSGLLSGALACIAVNQGDFEQARKYLQEALAIDQELGGSGGMAWEYIRLGEIASREENYPLAWTLLENAQDIYRLLDDKLGNYFVLDQMGKTARAQGDPQHAEALFTEALAITHQVGDRFHTAVTLRNLARAAFDQGEYARASQRYHEAIETGRAVEDNSTISRALRGLAEVSMASGDTAFPLRLNKEALQVIVESKDHKEIYLSLEALAALAVDLGQPEQAVRLFAATQSLYDSMCFSFSPRHCFIHSEKVASLKNQLGEAAFNAAWDQDQALTLEQAIQLALSL